MMMGLSNLSLISSARLRALLMVELFKELRIKGILRYNSNE